MPKLTSLSFSFSLCSEEQSAAHTTFLEADCQIILICIWRNIHGTQQTTTALAIGPQSISTNAISEPSFDWLTPGGIVILFHSKWNSGRVIFKADTFFFWFLSKICAYTKRRRGARAESHVVPRLFRNQMRVYHPLSAMKKRERKHLWSFSLRMLLKYWLYKWASQSHLLTEQGFLRCPCALNEQSKRFHSISNTDADCHVELPVECEQSSNSTFPRQRTSSTCSSHSRSTETTTLVSLQWQHEFHSLSSTDKIESKTAEFHPCPRNSIEHVETQRQFGEYISSATVTFAQSTLESQWSIRSAKSIRRFPSFFNEWSLLDLWDFRSLRQACLDRTRN